MDDLALIEARVAELGDLSLDGFEKGVPHVPAIRLKDVESKSWSLPGGDVPLPALALRWEAMLRNINRFQSFCDRRGVLLAPHGKTTMAPQIFLEQLRAGAWAITVASVRQVLVAHAFGVPRILLANEPTTQADFKSLGDLLSNPSGPELYAFVDDPDVAIRLARSLRESGTIRPLHLLIEFGFWGGRAGVRRVREVETVAQACLAATPELALAGIAGYEGIIRGSNSFERLRAVDEYLVEMAAAVNHLRHVHQEARMVSAGGSLYFDRVVELLGPEHLPDSNLVLRSGAYVTHDNGMYDLASPLGSNSERRLDDEPLEPALELWSSVVSRPEPELAILGFGRRDASNDSGLPVVLGVWDNDQIKPLPGATIVELNDQHAYLRLPAGTALRTDDAVVCGISHPCTVFEKWRTILTIDEQRTVTGAVRTFF